MSKIEENNRTSVPKMEDGEPAGKHELAYNHHLEELISSEAEKALVLRWLHNHAEMKYSRYNTFITLPVITISTLAGTASIGSDSLFGPDNTSAAVIIGLMSLLVSILNVINSFFGWSKRSEGHRISSINYAKMHRWISIELALPRDQRIPAKHFLKEIRGQIDRLNETSPLIPPDIVSQLRTKVKDLKNDVSLPEICDILERVDVYPESGGGVAVNEIVAEMKGNAAAVYNDVTETIVVDTTEARQEGTKQLPKISI